MKDKIPLALSKRNCLRHLLIRGNIDEGNAELLRGKTELCNERRKYKDCRKHWEEDWWSEIADKCEKAWKLGRLEEMYDILKKLQKREEYNNSKKILLFSKERFKEHLEEITENRYETDVIKTNNVLTKVQAPGIDEIKVKKYRQG